MVAADQHFSQNLIVGLPNFKKDRFQNNKKNLVSQNRFHFRHNFVCKVSVPNFFKDSCCLGSKVLKRI